MKVVRVVDRDNRAVFLSIEEISSMHSPSTFVGDDGSITMKNGRTYFLAPGEWELLKKRLELP